MKKGNTVTVTYHNVMVPDNADIAVVSVGDVVVGADSA